MVWNSDNSVGAPPAPRGRQQPSMTRCLMVWLSITVVTALGTILAATTVVDSLRTWWAPQASLDQALVTGAGVTAALLCPWLWLIATLAVLDALRGRVHENAGWTRRLTLIACGVAVTTTAMGAMGPAQAAPAQDTASGISPGTASLSGLPFPDRASDGKRLIDPAPRSREASATSTPSPSTDRPRARTHRVQAGDSLWAIAAATTQDPDLTHAVAELHRTNRRVIGDDPDLILPGQVLDVTSEGNDQR